MSNINYMNHETGKVYATHALAMEAYRQGVRIDLMDWSETLGEWVMRGYWEPWGD